MKKPLLSLIVPAYNEESRLPDTLGQLHEFANSQSYEIEVLIIENGSRDQSFQLAKNFSNQHTNFHAYHLEEKGKGLAVRFGMLKATGSYRMMLDADLSMPTDQIPRFIPPQIEKPEIVVASREAQGAVRYHEPQFRHIGGRAINLIIRLLALPGLQDSQCGFKCFRDDIAIDLFNVQKMDGWSFDIELLVIARRRGYRIEELAIPWYYNEQSHVSPIRDAFQIIFDLMKIRNNVSNGDYEPKL